MGGDRWHSGKSGYRDGPVAAAGRPGRDDIQLLTDAQLAERWQLSRGTLRISGLRDAVRRTERSEAHDGQAETTPSPVGEAETPTSDHR